jgi:hypothetical protein
MTSTIITAEQFEELRETLYSQGIIDEFDDIEFRKDSGYSPEISIEVAGNLDMALQAGAIIGSIPTFAPLLFNRSSLFGDSRSCRIVLLDCVLEEAR